MRPGFPRELAALLADCGDPDGLRARADAGDEHAAERLATLLARHGDHRRYVGWVVPVRGWPYPCRALTRRGVLAPGAAFKLGRRCGLGRSVVG